MAAIRKVSCISGILGGKFERHLDDRKQSETVREWHHTVTGFLHCGRTCLLCTFAGYSWVIHGYSGATRGWWVWKLTWKQLQVFEKNLNLLSCGWNLREKSPGFVFSKLSFFLISGIESDSQKKIMTISKSTNELMNR